MYIETFGIWISHGNIDDISRQRLKQLPLSRDAIKLSECSLRALNQFKQGYCNLLHNSFLRTKSPLHTQFIHCEHRTFAVVLKIAFCRNLFYSRTIWKFHTNKIEVKHFQLSLKVAIIFAWQPFSFKLVQYRCLICLNQKKIHCKVDNIYFAVYFLLIETMQSR